MIAGAGNGIRTRDPNLGKVVLYQLSYSRVGASTYQSRLGIVNSKPIPTESVREFGAPTPLRWVSTAVPWVPVVRVFGRSPDPATD